MNNESVFILLNIVELIPRVKNIFIFFWGVPEGGGSQKRR